MLSLTEAQQDFIRLDLQSKEFRDCLNDLLNSTDFVKTLRKEDLDVINQIWSFKGKSVTERRAELTYMLLEHPALKSKSLLEFTPKLMFLKQIRSEALVQPNQKPASEARTLYVPELGKEIYIGEHGFEE
jgi:hypothetical protein